MSTEPIDVAGSVHPNEAELLRRLARAAEVNATRRPGGETPTLKLDWLLALGRRDGWACAYCGVPLAIGPWQPTATVDHVMPKALGGHGRALTNMALACPPCNNAKGESLPVGRWRPRIDRHHLRYSGRKEFSYRVHLAWAHP